MQIIEQSFNVWEHDSDLASIWHHIAEVAKLVYPNDVRNKVNESYKNFVERVVEKYCDTKILEHGTVYLTIPNKSGIIYDGPSMPEVLKYKENPYSKVAICIMDDKWYVTTNMRVIKDNGWEQDLFDYISVPTIYHKKRISICLNTSAKLANIYCLYRSHSVSRESIKARSWATRTYKGELNFIKPYWYDEVATDVRDYYNLSLQNQELSYNHMLKTGLYPQEAMSVLPLSISVKQLHTAYIEDWVRFIDGNYFNLDADNRDIISMLRDWFKNKGLYTHSDIFDET